METLVKGQEKIQKICEVLRKETLEPALEEASALIEDAKDRAAKILKEAKEEAALLIKKAKDEIARERNVFHASLSQAAKQTLETLRQHIEHQLFDPELKKLIGKEMAKPETIAELIKVLVKAIEKDGLGANLDIVIPKSIPAKEISLLIASEVLRNDKELHLGDFFGGAKIKIGEKNITIEITDAVVENLVASYVRKDFRDRLFNKHV